MQISSFAFVLIFTGIFKSGSLHPGWHYCGAHDMLGDFHEQMKLRIIEKSYRNVINNQKMVTEQPLLFL